ncbi:quinone-dependent dihydroorotate dehydrogenase [Patescibacteria group bacterium]|nr:quinone-dependent dihydroorotate dehydrogenase [Patescibacteria group bacterium]MCL5091512.1 quinone-dependent dihydroorotate dehydrogenase [Patescibacteria group bacterium]
MLFYYLTALVLAGLGWLDARYLTLVHYQQAILVCARYTIFVDCGKVLQSPYSAMFGIPLAVIGLINYSLLLLAISASFLTRKKLFSYWLVIQTAGAFLASVYFMYLQIFVIGSLCLYCTGSALISLLLFLIVLVSQKPAVLDVVGMIYQLVIKPVFFWFDAELVHETVINLGQILGRVWLVKSILVFFMKSNRPALHQTLAGISFTGPVGLAAGFDYQAKLTRLLPNLGFGFQTVGTITNRPYGGNPPPRLGRLPKSKSLLVNKGFKNPGASATISRLTNEEFAIPVGISLGRTNSRRLVTQRLSVNDITEAFEKFEHSGLRHAYYELNISCPNLLGKVEFYSTRHLTQLLTALRSQKISRPVFVKMPIEKTDRQFLAMLQIISRFSFMKGVIIGNLQKDRRDPAFDQEEIKRAGRGNFSGKPTWKRSNELIKLTYQAYKRRFVIVGCGGVFSAQDAYEKIKLGASLVQLITGMIYQGPQLIAQINLGLEERLRQDGFRSIQEAIGTA